MCSNNTLCIYDFDDTLFPSTLLSKSVMCNNKKYSNNMNDDIIEINDELVNEFGKKYNKELRALELSIVSILTQSIKHFGSNNVYIVTNATLDWIRVILATLIPDTLPIFSQVQIISARVLSSPFYPTSQLMWKIHTFHQLTLFSFGIKYNLPDQNVINYHVTKLEAWNAGFHALAKQASNPEPKSSAMDADDVDAELSESNTSRSISSLSSLRSEIGIEEDVYNAMNEEDQEEQKQLADNSQDIDDGILATLKPDRHRKTHKQAYRIVSIGDSESERLACKCISNAIYNQVNGNSIYQSVKFVKHPNFAHITQQLYYLENNLSLIGSSSQNIDIPSSFLFNNVASSSSSLSK